MQSSALYSGHTEPWESKPTNWIKSFILPYQCTILVGKHWCSCHIKCHPDTLLKDNQLTGQFTTVKVTTQRCIHKDTHTQRFRICAHLRFGTLVTNKTGLVRCYKHTVFFTAYASIRASVESIDWWTTAYIYTCTQLLLLECSFLVHSMDQLADMFPYHCSHNHTPHHPQLSHYHTPVVLVLLQKSEHKNICPPVDVLYVTFNKAKSFGTNGSTHDVLTARWELNMYYIMMNNWTVTLCTLLLFGWDPSVALGYMI